MRLQGPRPQFARADGGEGGSHPSNVHDHVYAIGTINFTGAAAECSLLLTWQKPRLKALKRLLAPFSASHFSVAQPSQSQRPFCLSPQLHAIIVVLETHYAYIVVNVVFAICPVLFWIGFPYPTLNPNP